VRADQLREQLANLNKTTEEGAKKTGLFGLSLTDLKSGIDMAMGAAKTFIEVAKKAFEFTQEGAAINATKESFDRLGISIEAMRAASNNTIPDVKLMSSTLTLMAGSSGEVADAFSAAMPQLLAMAKAANKLNPTMGDTTYMLESITTAAKRQSMQIADNLGIIVKQGDAYEKYAKSIGVAVSELTNEQKQIAFLNGLMEAGNVLIEQAGGTTESAADSWAQLTAAIKNNTDETKANLAEAVLPLMQNLARQTELQGQLKESGRGYVDLMIHGKHAIAEMNAELQNQAVASERATKQAEYLAQQTEEWTAQQELAKKEAMAILGTLEESGPAWDAYSAAMDTANAGLQGLTKEQSAANEAAVAAQGAFLNAAAALSEMSVASFVQAQLAELKKEVDAGRLSNEEYVAAQEAILTQFGLLTEEEKRMQTTINAITKAFADGKIEPEEYARLLADVKAQVDALDGSMINIGWNVQAPPAMGGSPGGMSGPGGIGDITTPYQHGGTSWGRSMLVGEHGPEMLTGVPGGARVLSNPTTARMMAQNNTTTNNYNLTTNALTRPGGLAMEFSAMEMGSR
jgi:hypothetical protein